MTSIDGTVNVGFGLKPVFKSHEGNGSTCLYLSENIVLESSNLFLGYKVLGIYFLID